MSGNILAQAQLIHSLCLRRSHCLAQYYLHQDTHQDGVCMQFTFFCCKCLFWQCFLPLPIVYGGTCPWWPNFFYHCMIDDVDIVEAIISLSYHTCVELVWLIHFTRFSSALEKQQNFLSYHFRIWSVMGYLFKRKSQFCGLDFQTSKGVKQLTELWWRTSLCFVPQNESHDFKRFSSPHLFEFFFF